MFRSNRCAQWETNSSWIRELTEFPASSCRVTRASWLLQYAKILSPRFRALPSHEAVLITRHLLFSTGKQGLFVRPPLHLPFLYWQLLHSWFIWRLQRANVLYHQRRVTVSTIYTTNTTTSPVWRVIVTLALGSHTSYKLYYLGQWCKSVSMKKKNTNFTNLDKNTVVRFLETCSLRSCRFHMV